MCHFFVCIAKGARQPCRSLPLITVAACLLVLQAHVEKQAARAAQTVKDAPQATFSSKSASFSQAKEPSPANYTIMSQQQEIRKEGFQKLFF